MSNLVYPSIVLEGVTSQQELQYLKKAYKDKGDNKLPFYMSAFGKFKEVGYISLDVDSVLNLAHIDSRYKIWLYKSEDNKVLIDHDDDATLIKLIKL